MELLQILFNIIWVMINLGNCFQNGHLKLVKLLSNISVIFRNQLPNYNKPVDKNRLTEIMEFQIDNLKANKNKLVEIVSKLGLRSR